LRQESLNQNARYVAQPYDVAGNLFRFTEPASVPQSTHTFRWQSAGVDFESWQGQSALPGPVMAQHSFTAGIPPTGNENIRMNLWLYQGRAPSNGSAAEVLVKGFEFP